MTLFDLENADDSVPRKQLQRAMSRMNVKNKQINIAKRLLFSGTGTDKIGNRLREIIDITKQFKLGYTKFFLVYGSSPRNVIQKMWENGYPNTRNILHSFRFADGPVIFAQDTDSMEYVIKKLKEEYE